MLPLMLCICFASLFTVKAAAESGGSFIGGDSFNLHQYIEYDDEDWDEDEDDEIRVTRKIEFTLDESAYIRILYIINPVGINVDNVETDGNEYVSSGKVRFRIYDNDDNLVDEYTYNAKGDVSGEDYDGWFYLGEKLSSGDYTLKVSGSGTMEYYSGDSEASYHVDCEIKSYKSFAKRATIKKKASGKGGSWIKIGKFESGLPHFKSIKFSNKKAVDDWWISNNGTIYVWARSKGSSTVTLKLKSGKIYKTKVTVKPGYPNFFAYLYGYNTRGNYFTVKVKNLGVSNLTIIPAGTKATDKDYKSYDRYIKKRKNIVIAPGKTKNVRFYVNGRTTWPDCLDFTIHSSFKYEGKTYAWKTAYNYSWYKRGKSWYNTFWNFSDYDRWYWWD